MENWYQDMKSQNYEMTIKAKTWMDKITRWQLKLRHKKSNLRGDNWSQDMVKTKFRDARLILKHDKLKLRYGKLKLRYDKSKSCDDKLKLRHNLSQKY